MSDLALRLTAKQRAFANELAAGIGPSEAYRRAYNTQAKDNLVAAKAGHLKAKPKLQAYLAELIAAQERKRFLTRERKRERLSQIVENAKEKTGDVIRAIEVDNVMTGDNAPQQVQVFGLSELLAMVRKKS
jgi:hypothetical protein